MNSNSTLSHTALWADAPKSPRNCSKRTPQSSFGPLRTWPAPNWTAGSTMFWDKHEPMLTKLGSASTKLGSSLG